MKNSNIRMYTREKQEIIIGLNNRIDYLENEILKNKKTLL